MEEQERKNHRSTLCSLCADYLDAATRQLFGTGDGTELADLEDLIMKEVTPLSFMNTLEKEVASADSN